MREKADQDKSAVAANSPLGILILGLLSFNFSEQ